MSGAEAKASPKRAPESAEVDAKPSDLPSGHPKAFQRLPVRSSRQFYLSFNLPKGRSLGFASTSADSNALFGLAFASAPDIIVFNLANDGDS